MLSSNVPDARAGASTELQALRHDYESRGWIKLTRIVAPDRVRRLREIVAEAERRPEFKVKTSGVQADQASTEYEKTMRVLRRLWTHYPEVEELTRQVGQVVHRITGWRTTRLWSDRVFIKPGRLTGSRPTLWHQDLPKIPIDRRGFTTVWIAISDIPITRGPMTFLNGSHRLGPLGATAQLGDAADLSEILDDADWSQVQGCTTAAPLEPGDATMHAGLTLHRARKNVEEDDRVVLAISYLDGDALYTGGANPVTDDLGITPYKLLEHPTMPLVA